MKEYFKKYGIDFNQTFAAVIKPIVFRIIFTIIKFYNLDIDSIDVKTAFLYELIDQLVYVEILKETKTKANQGKVCKLLKAMYNLKQSFCL